MRAIFMTTSNRNGAAAGNVHLYDNIALARLVSGCHLGWRLNASERGKLMGWRDGYIAVDWGTTNRRAYAVDRDGTVAVSVRDGQGIMNVPAGGFEEAVAGLRAQLGDRPMLLAGMIGSNRGWREAPYVPCPADAAAIAAAILWIEPGRLGIVPGVSQTGDEADVMRGEEVQAIGAIASLPDDALICHPGTHSKWIVMRGGRIDHFRTLMTGELFALLKAHSILAPQLRDVPAPDASFDAGVAAGLAGEAPQAGLFGVRARHLLGRGDANGASYASGLLIGADIRTGLGHGGNGPIGLVGRSDLRALYAAGLAKAGREAIEIAGSDAFLAGIGLLTERL
jgi:2-dehydro-3-deoxygalactonokinase